jgi:hypothetical protein
MCSGGYVPSLLYRVTATPDIANPVLWVQKIDQYISRKPMLEECQKVVQVTPWYILILVAVCGAIAATLFNRYFAISAGKFPAAHKLISSIQETLAWTEKPDSTVGPREDVSPEAFCDLLSNCWPWEQKKLISVWRTYHSVQGGIVVKAPILRELLDLVNRYSGFA